MEQRSGRGIWNGLYQFPLVESEKMIGEYELKKHQRLKELLDNPDFSIELFNENPVVHKLSHQHLYTRFWIVNSAKTEVNSVSLEEVTNYPVPVLIENFLNEYLPEAYK